MKAILLGTAAGGGFPQWNCWCPGCRTARSDRTRARPRTQSSIAVSHDGRHWLLINASPDVRDQLCRIPRGDQPANVVRDVPIDGVAVTDAELDHTIGLLLLREARALTLYAGATATAILESDSCLLPTLRAFATVSTVPLAHGRPVAFRLPDGTESGLTIEAFPVRGDPPRFARSKAMDASVGLVVRDALGATLVYVPGCGAIDESVAERLRSGNAVVFDGTFWRDDELPALGISPKRARDMGHLPVGGRGGSLEFLADVAAPVRVYTHINNTNPILLEDSAERRAVEAAGVVVGYDGLTIEI